MVNNLNVLFYLVVNDFQITDKNKLNSIVEHKELLEAIKKGFIVDVEKILSKHYKNSLDAVLKYRFLLNKSSPNIPVR